VRKKAVPEGTGLPNILRKDPLPSLASCGKYIYT
jgi:hypothetical protein